MVAGAGNRSADRFVDQRLVSVAFLLLPGYAPITVHCAVNYPTTSGVGPHSVLVRLQERACRLAFAELPKTISGKIRRVQLCGRETELQTTHSRGVYEFKRILPS